MGLKSVICFALLATPALADQLRLPDGCTGLVSIQAKDCTVSHYYRCEGEPEGWTHRVDMSEDGLDFSSYTDDEARWVESVSAHDGLVDRLGNETDPASLSGLIASGRDDWDFFVLSNNGVKQRFIGHDALTGEDVVIDGVTLKRTEFSMRVENSQGDFLWSSEGREYVAPQWNIFIGGIREVNGPNGTFTRDGSPARIIQPGQEGFLARDPIYGCGVMMSGGFGSLAHG